MVEKWLVMLMLGSIGNAIDRKLKTIEKQTSVVQLVMTRKVFENSETLRKYLKTLNKYKITF
jgi:hypothetical protein